MIPPADFVPLAEETALILPIGEWVLRQACKDAAGWPSPVSVAVNLSPMTFAQSEFTLETVRRLRALSVRIVMDDFGTGHSSLSNLRNFPFDKIKIDGSFVNDLASKKDSKPLSWRLCNWREAWERIRSEKVSRSKET